MVYSDLDYKYDMFEDIWWRLSIRDGLTCRELADELIFKYHEVYPYLQMMVQEGWLDKDGSIHRHTIGWYTGQVKYWKSEKGKAEFDEEVVAA
jgi:hypothetical protein